MIGGGVAGVAAALELAAAGARVALVRAGPGASALAAGGWAGPLPARLGAALAGVGLRHVPAPHPLPHPAGLLRAYDFAAEPHVGPPIDERARVIGITGLPAFHARALARLWGCREAVPVALPETPAAGWSPVSLAARLDQDGEPLLRAVGDVAGGASVVILPAVLGLGPSGLAGMLAGRLGVPVVEALGTPPSVPGWRLDRALLASLEAAGIPRIDGRVIGRDVAAGNVQSVTVRNASGTVSIGAGAFVLATGRFVGGGIRARPFEEPVAVASGSALRDAALVEGALGCDVWIDHLDQQFTTVQPVPLTDAVRTAAQPLLGAGVHVDEAGRPVDAYGDARYRNVTVAGSVIAALAPGLGHAAETGARSVAA